MIKLIEWKKNCKCWHIGYIHYPRVSHKLVFQWILWFHGYECGLKQRFNYNCFFCSERVCCLCIHIACKNSFHNTTYVRGFDAFWLIMGRLVSFHPCVSSVNARNRRRRNLATFQFHIAFPVGHVLDCSEDGSGKFFRSVPNYFQSTRRHKPEDLCRQPRRPLFTECCNGHVVDVAHAITRCQI